MNKAIYGDSAIKQYLKPENELEERMLNDVTFLEGVLWGEPRYGHPEGKVLYHIREVLDNVDKLQISSEERRKLRLITFVHDTFKHQEHKGSPRDWSRHHSILAKQYLEKLSDEKDVLDVIETHDEAYYCWRLSQIYSQPVQSQHRLNKLVKKLGNSIQLYYMFFKCDTCTGDKNLNSLYWVEENLPGITIVDL